MYQNPYPNDPAATQASGPPDMEELPLKQAPPPVSGAAQPIVPGSGPGIGDEGVNPEEEGEVIEAREEARTVKFAIGKLNDFLQWFIVVLEITLLLRFLFKLIGANPDNIFAAFLYALTDIVLYPFSNLVGAPSLHQNQSFEWSTLIAMLIYWLVFYAIRKFLSILISEPEPSTP
ncbi:MAG TPA: YggT family protein [Ktedonobacteraceae bacterium]|nr:YggT family protein [Ktedonobacteraceae bacterium]